MSRETKLLLNTFNEKLNIWDFKDYGPNSLQVEGEVSLKDTLCCFCNERIGTQSS